MTGSSVFVTLRAFLAGAAASPLGSGASTGASASASASAYSDRVADESNWKSPLSLMRARTLISPAVPSAPLRTFLTVQRAIHDAPPGTADESA